MGFIRVASVSPELRVADIEFNNTLISQSIQKAEKANVNIIVFPEMCITGYTCGDLFFQKLLLDNAIESVLNLAKAHSKSKIISIVGAPIQISDKIYNAAFILQNGKILGIVPKTYLPNNAEFYEERWFASSFHCSESFIEIKDELIPFGADLLFVNKETEMIFGIEICEDLWAVIPPSSMMSIAGANLIFNLSASDEYLGKYQYRKNLVITQSARYLSGYIYASAGPNESSSDLVYSGQCMVAENGVLLQESQRFQFESQMIIADLDIDKLKSERTKNTSYRKSERGIDYRMIECDIKHIQDTIFQRQISRTPFIPSDESVRSETCEEIFNIQQTGLAKRLKHIACKNVVIGVSGGLDSTLALLVTHKAFQKLGMNPNGIHAITMPGFGTTQKTYMNAQKLSGMLNCTFLEVDIKPAVNQHFKDIQHDINLLDTTYENAQARERTQILMDYANKVKGIVIGTGDLSEMALGWSTYNGDHMSMYGINAGVPKTLIKYIIEWCINTETDEKYCKVLLDIISTPISPELLPPGKGDKIEQKTEDQIGPYILHDFFLYHFIRNSYPPLKIMELAAYSFKGEYSRQVIIKYLKLFFKKFFENQFKRNCLPDSVKVGSVALSPRGDWRMPSDSLPNIWLNDLDTLK